MITIITKTTTIFVNEDAIERVEHDRMNGTARIHLRRDAWMALGHTCEEYTDVTSVGYTSDAQPTSLVFNSKGK